MAVPNSIPTEMINSISSGESDFVSLKIIFIDPIISNFENNGIIAAEPSSIPSKNFSNNSGKLSLLSTTPLLKTIS